MPDIANVDKSVTVCRWIKSDKFIGVTDDKDPNSVLVTLNEKVALKYKVTNQKELYQWNTKKIFASCIVHDFIDDKYVGFFKNNSIRIWSENDFLIDEIKKLKFTTPIYTLISHKDHSPLVLFKNGLVSNLKECVGLRKQQLESPIFDKFDEFIDYSVVFNSNSTISIALLSNTLKIIYFELIENEMKNIDEIDLGRIGFELKSFLLTNSKNGLTILSYWSDNQLYSYDIPVKSNGLSLLTNFDENMFQNVNLQTIDESRVILYGNCAKSADSILLLYNFQMKTIESYQKFENENFKMTRIWVIGRNIFFVYNGNLKLLQIQLEKQTSELLLGSLSDFCDKEADIIMDDPNFELIDGLIKKDDLKSVKRALKEITNLTEKTLMKLIAFAIKDIDLKSIEVTNYQKQRNKLLEKALNYRYDHVQIIRFLKSELTVDQAIYLLNYNCILAELKSQKAIYIHWARTLLDCFHNQIILYYDNDRVSDMITRYREFTKRFNQCIRRDIFELEICINLSEKGHILQEVTLVSNPGSYEIEYLNLGLETDESDNDNK